MRRTLAIVAAFILGITAPAFAQSPNQGVSNQGVPNGASPVGPDGQPLNDQGLDALAQDVPPPPPNYTPLIIGGIVVGGVIAGVVIANSNNDNTTAVNTNTPASP